MIFLNGTQVVTLEKSYTQSKITVRANAIVLNSLFNIYTIYNITTDQMITIDGLDINQFTLVFKTNIEETINPLRVFVVKRGESQIFDIIPNYVRTYCL